MSGAAKPARPRTKAAQAGGRASGPGSDGHRADRSGLSLDPHELLGVAESLLRHAKGHQAEVYLEKSAGLDVSIEREMIGASGLSVAAGGAWRVVHDGRVGFSYFTDPVDAPRALEQALAQSRHAVDKGFHFPPPARIASVQPRWDDAIAALRVDDALSMARDLLRSVKTELPEAVLSGGGAGLDAGVMAIASTEGMAVSDRSTGVSVGASLVLAEGQRSISASESAASIYLAGADAAAVGAKVAATVRSLRSATPLRSGGPRDVILSPDAAAELVVSLAVEAAMGDEARRGKTVWSDKLGQPVAAKGLHLLDDSRAAGAIGGVPFDDEGVPTRRLPILEDGVLRNFLYDCWDANEHSARSTASAGRGGFKSRPSTTTHHLVLEGPASPLDKLVAGIDNGVMVESLLGAHTANVTTGDFSVTSPNVWHIRKGAVAGACRDVALSGRIGELLMRLDGVSREAKAMDGARIPYVRLRGVDLSV